MGESKFDELWSRVTRIEDHHSATVIAIQHGGSELLAKVPRVEGYRRSNPLRIVPV
jgi:hypothetical protein